MNQEFDGKIYFPYTDACKEQVMSRLSEYCPDEEPSVIFHRIHEKYMEYLGLFHRDLGGKSNSRNGVGGTYDCILLCCVHEICGDRIPLMEFEEIEKDLLLPTFEKLSFADMNKPFLRKLYHTADRIAAWKGNKIDDYHMVVEPYDKNQPIRYRFTSCPVAEFVKQFGFEDVLPYLCNADYYSLELMHARLVRVHTLGNGSLCDYAICGDRDSYLKEHEEYRDEQGYIRNR